MVDAKHDQPSQAPADSSKAVQETIELHDFLEAWFVGRLPQTQAAFARFDQALAANFVIVGPDGTLADREQVVQAVYADWGRWHDDEAARIVIKNPVTRHQHGDHTTVTYEEWQTTKDGTVARLSTVDLHTNPNAPLGLQWTHLHETWIKP